MLPLLLFLGTASALENGLARTPPMGWMSWTLFMCQTNCVKYPNACINEQLYQQMADRLVNDGFLAVGYNRIHVDDCWMTKQRDAQGYLVPDPDRFPNGIDGLASYMHDRGLEFAIYEDAGNETCMGYPGSLNYYQKDADTFAKWGCDYLKFDGCWENIYSMGTVYPQMATALKNTGHPMVYSCSWPAYMEDHQKIINYQSIVNNCNLWRNYGDVSNSWSSIYSIFKWYHTNQDRLSLFHGPGHWNDPDMIIAGNPGITFDQAKFQFTAWSMWSAPLILSNDLRTLATQYKQLLQNKDVIAVDQDPLGIMGKVVIQTAGNDVLLMTKPMTPNKGDVYSFALAGLNVNENLKHTVNVKLSQLGLSNTVGYQVKDLYSGASLGILKPNDIISFANIPPTGAIMFKATAQF